MRCQHFGTQYQCWRQELCKWSSGASSNLGLWTCFGKTCVSTHLFGPRNLQGFRFDPIAVRPEDTLNWEEYLRTTLKASSMSIDSCKHPDPCTNFLICEGFIFANMGTHSWRQFLDWNSSTIRSIRTHICVDEYLHNLHSHETFQSASFFHILRACSRHGKVCQCPFPNL